MFGGGEGEGGVGSEWVGRGSEGPSWGVGDGASSEDKEGSGDTAGSE